MNATTREQGAREWRSLWLILLLGFALRVGLGVLHPSIAHPDEIFQYQEPAHRFLTGLGVPSWEWNHHIRSWFIPGLVLPIMASVRIFTHDPVIYFDVIALLLSLASLPVIWVAFIWGRQEGGREGGIVAGLLAAVAFQLVYFSSHLLMDTLAVDLLLPALYACREYRRHGSLRSLAVGCASLAVLAFVRPQIAPVLLFPGIATLRAAKHRGQMLPGMTWSLGPLLVLGGLDWITLGTPFQSIWRYIYINLFRVADDFGVAPFYWYLKNMLLAWTIAVVPIGYFSGRAASKFRVEFVTAWLIVALLSAIQHKEARFILPAEAILLILAGVGIAQCRFGHTRAIAATICATSLALCFTPTFFPQLSRGHAELRAMNQIMQRPDACGIYFLPRPSLLNFSGYTGARDGVALRSDRFDTATENLRRANYIVTWLQPDETATVPPDYSRLDCRNDAGGRQICVYRRPGACG